MVHVVEGGRGGGLLIQFDASVNLHGIALEVAKKEQSRKTIEGREERRSETDREKVESVSVRKEGTKSVISSRNVERFDLGPIQAVKKRTSKPLLYS